MGDVLEIPLEDRLERKIIKDEKRERKIGKNGKLS